MPVKTGAFFDEDSSKVSSNMDYRLLKNCARSGRAGTRLCYLDPCTHSTPSETLIKIHHNRAGNKDGRISANDHSHHQGEGESVDNFATKQEQGENRQEGEARGQNGSAKSLIDTVVDKFGEVPAFCSMNVLPDSIEDYDRIIHGVAHEGQQGRDHRESNFLVQQREKPERNDHIVEGGNHGCNPVD